MEKSNNKKNIQQNNQTKAKIRLNKPQRRMKKVEKSVPDYEE